MKDFEVVHTKQLHLFVISQDMEFFEHIHPTMGTDGTWRVETSVPRAGYYQVLCDFMPKGGSGQFLKAPWVTAGSVGDLLSNSAHLTPDKDFRKSRPRCDSDTVVQSPAARVGRVHALHLHCDRHDVRAARHRPSNLPRAVQPHAADE